ncbi:MAG: nucleoside deaminase [Firmicutes bacterium]|nr:tRNA-specific adenosine deaminase [Bacillota bacterium]MBO2518266.1 tRNA-specific adenosine deaminase [Bacillota bacterium]NMA71099.1 nucleoside deaminase [Bacillota bacterium]
MGLALAEAKKAWALGEVPIGAVVVRDGEVLARAHNLRETWGDPTAHAELIAIREAARRVGGWRLTGATVYATIEPCPMCAGALLLARVDRLVYGAPDPKGGAVDSLVRLLDDPRFNHQVRVTSGVRAEEGADLLRRFFRQLREGSGGTVWRGC